MLGSRRFKGCGSGQPECELSMSVGRSEESGEGEKDGAELPREEPEDVDGESGGVGCLSLTWMKGRMSISTFEGEGKSRTGAGEGEQLGGVWVEIKKVGWCAGAAE